MDKKTAKWMKILALLLFAVLVINVTGFKLPLEKSAVTEGKGTEEAAPKTTPVNCPSDMVTALNLAVENSLNTSDEFLAQTWKIFTENGQEVTSITTTAGGTKSFASVNLECGQTYILYPLTDDDANARFKSVAVDQAASYEVVGIDDYDNIGVKVTLKGTNTYVTVKGYKHADAVYVRMYDNINQNFYYNATASSNTQWIAVADGADAKFYTTTSNSTEEDVGANGDLDFTIQIKTQNNYEELNDLGILVLVDAGSSAESYWNDFCIEFEGQEYCDASTELTPEEAKRFSEYDWVFIIPPEASIKSTYKTFHFPMKATSNDPSSDIKITFAIRGTYQGIEDDKIHVGAAKDDSSHSKVVSEFTVYKMIS